MTDEALTSAKRSVRERVLAQRDALDAQARRELSARITARLLALPAYLEAAEVAAYASFGSEFDTTDFVLDVLARGKRLLLPRIDRERRALELRRVTDPERDLVAGTWGIREPDPAKCRRIDPTEVGFVLVPGVAFTPQGARLGYGGGYYDALLARCNPAAPKVAAAFARQILDTLPTGRHDIPVDLVITETTVYDGNARPPHD